MPRQFHHDQNGPVHFLNSGDAIRGGVHRVESVTTRTGTERVYLPRISDGKGITVETGTVVTIKAAAAQIEVCSLAGHRVGFIQPWDERDALAVAGFEQDSPDVWRLK
jgi:hypothetical protein